MIDLSFGAQGGRVLDNEEKLQRMLLSSMKGQIDATDIFFRAVLGGKEVECLMKNRDLETELRMRAEELISLRDEVERSSPGWTKELLGDANRIKDRAFSLFR